MAATAIIENNSISTRIMPNVIDDNNSTSVRKNQEPTESTKTHYYQTSTIRTTTPREGT